MSPASELRRAEKRRRLHPREQAAALLGELDGAAAVDEGAGQITPQAEHLAQERVRAVEGLDRGLALLGEEGAQGGLGLGRASEVGARERPPHAAQPGAVERPTASARPATRATSVRARSAVARAGARWPTASSAWASTERISNSKIGSDPSASSVARSAHARYCCTSPASPHRRP